jgi:hypothetical protein
MVSVGSLAEQRAEVAKVATTLFGKPFAPDQVINETLARSLDYKGLLPSSDALAQAIDAGVNQNADADSLKLHPVAVWLENAVALEEREGRLVRGKPQRLSAIVESLAVASGKTVGDCLVFCSIYCSGSVPSINECRRQDNAIRNCHSSFINSSRKPGLSIQHSIRMKSVSSRLSLVFSKPTRQTRSRSFRMCSVGPVATRSFLFPG